MTHAPPSPLRRATRALALVAALALLATACGGDDTDPDAGSGEVTNTTAAPDTDEVTTGGTLVVALEAETNSWLPGTGTFANSGTNVARAIYDSIAARGADGQVYPNLAESIEPNEELTEWTVTLREGLTFHDDTPLDAEAVKANFDGWLTADTSNLTGDLAEVTELRVDGPLTYTYVLSGPNVAFPDKLVGAIGWPFSPTACEAAGPDCGSQPVGAGPFEFVSWTRDDEIRLVRNDDYWRTDAAGNQLPYLDELVFRPIPDESSRFQTVLAGDAQVGQTLRQSIVREVRQAVDAGDMRTYEAIGNNGGGAIFNTLKPPVDDQRVRLGLAHAVNQEDLIALLGGEGITPPQTQYFSPDSPWYSAAVEDAWPAYDPAEAERILAEYVEDPQRSDGKQPGEPISVTFACPPDPSLIQVSQGYQAMWTEVGVEVELEQVEQSTHIENALGVGTDPPFSGNFMINCWRMGDNEDPYSSLSSAFGDPSTQPLNFTNYTSDNITEQIRILGTSTDRDERYAAVESIMMELTEQVPNLWTGGTATALYTTPQVRNLAGWTVPDGSPGDGAIGATTYWAEVWIEQ